jgi:hypothetical protein
MTLLKYVATAAGGFALALVLTQSDLWAAAVAPRFPKGIPNLTENNSGPPGGNWLAGAKDDAERFRRLQIYAGGTDQQMWQVGYRYEQTHQAIADGNWDFAVYQWGKMRDVMNVAFMKRPNRTPNGEVFFLDSVWGQVDAALKAKDPKAARDAFNNVGRLACQGCHEAEGMPWLNNQIVFKKTASFPN